MTKVVIIGSGIAGLCAGSQLIKNPELEITLLEQSKAVGGRLQTIEYGGFHFDIGATLLTPHFIEFIDKTYGLKIDVLDIYWDTIAFTSRERLRIDDSTVTLDDIEKITGEKHEVDDFIWNAILFLDKLKDFPTYTIDQFLNEIDVNKKLQVFLQSGAIDAGLPSDQASAYVLKLMEYAHHFKYPVGGTGQVSVQLANNFTKKGGEIKLNASVTSIEEIGEKVRISLVENGMVSVIDADFVISTVGVKKSLGLIQSDSKELSHARSKLQQVIPTIATTHLMFTYDEDAKKDYIARSPLNNYYPYDTVKEINAHIDAIMKDGNNIPFGFYCHFPALYDVTQVRDGRWPVSFWLVTTSDPTNEEIEAMKLYCIQQFDEYFMPGFKDHYTYLGSDKPIDFTKNYGDPGTTSSIAPIVGYPTFEPQMTQRIFLAGSGVNSDLASSVIQASQSGHDVADLIGNRIIGRKRNSICTFVRKIFGRT